MESGGTGGSGEGKGSSAPWLSNDDGNNVRLTQSLVFMQFVAHKTAVENGKRMQGRDVL